MDVPAWMLDGAPNCSGLLGRVIAIDHKISRLQLSAGDEINGALLRKIADAAGEKPLTVSVRTVLKCKAEIGICRTVLRLVDGHRQDERAGLRCVHGACTVDRRAGQRSLTMCTFHTGGVAGLFITHGLPRVVELFEVRKP